MATTMKSQKLAAVHVAINAALDTDPRSARAKARKLSQIVRDARRVKDGRYTRSAAIVPGTRENGDYAMHLRQEPHIYLSDRQRTKMIREIVAAY
jgi:hypothetical protein